MVWRPLSLDFAFVISQELMGIHHGVSKKDELDKRISRSIERFLSVSNEKVDWGEAVQKERKEADLDGEVDNEMKKITYYFYCIHFYCTVCFITDDFLYCVQTGMLHVSFK